MKNHGGATIVSDHSVKPKKSKSREVSSRFLSPHSSTTSSSTEYGIQSPNSILSPVRQKPRSSLDSRKHKSLENSGFLRGLWPSSSNPSPFSNSKADITLADRIEHDRLKDTAEIKRNQNSALLNRQRSCSELSRIENEKRAVAKENHKPIFQGSKRYSGMFKFPGKSSKSSTLIHDQNDSRPVPGRYSVDEIALQNKSFGRGVLSDSDTQESESEYSGLCSGTSFETPVTGKIIQATSYMAPTLSSRNHGMEDSSKLMHELSSRSRRWSADSVVNQKPFSPDHNNNSPKIFSLKNSMKKANSKWDLSPGRSGSPTNLLADNKGKMIGLSSLKPPTSSSSKPPTSPSKGKGVGNFFTMGIELLTGKKSSSNSVSSPLGPGSTENVHQLRLFHNRFVQWRYSNARAEAVNGNIIQRAENNFHCAWNSLIKLHHSVLQKKLQLQKEKLEIKLSCILQSQIKELEKWGHMERQHLSAVSITKDCLHSVVCRIPLIDGAKVETQSLSIAVRHASDVAASINSMLNACSPMMEKTAVVFVELAMVITQEKLVLEECLELFRAISALEMQERSLKSSIMQFKSLQQH